MGLYEVGRIIVRSFFSVFFKVEVIGVDRIPKKGGVILCCNHISNFDPPLLGAFVKRRIHYMAKQELFKIPLFNSLIKTLGAFPVRRGMSDKRALKTAMNLLKEGHIVGLFPEGTRSRNGVLKKGLAGAGFIALRTDATVIPCAIIGPYKPFQKVKIVYGEAINFSQLRNEKASAEEATALIMEHIRKLIETHS